MVDDPPLPLRGRGEACAPLDAGFGHGPRRRRGACAGGGAALVVEQLEDRCAVVVAAREHRCAPAGEHRGDLLHAHVHRPLRHHEQFVHRLQKRQRWINISFVVFSFIFIGFFVYNMWIQ